MKQNLQLEGSLRKLAELNKAGEYESFLVTENGIGEWKEKGSVPSR